MAANVAGAAEGTEWLYGQGFKRVACITGPRHVTTARQRRAGWAEATHAHGPLNEDYLLWSDYHAAGGHAAMLRLLGLETPPDAAFVANNLMAMGAIGALRESGLQPPEFGLAVFGDLPFVPWERYAVHVVPLQAREIGAHAARLLLDRINGEVGSPRKIIIDSSGRPSDEHVDAGRAALVGQIESLAQPPPACSPRVRSQTGLLPD
ncbi:substrate-binding domain-containing protein [Sinomonas cellulolyticus]|uniref:substrate-binding domain-containing protein n=1 Tax=Sinomonas cellulolyticus TaxID=2801916 RepID=UPI0035AC0F93